MANVRVVVDPAQSKAFFENDPTMQKALQLAAEAIVEQTKELAPIGQSLSWPRRNPIRHGWYRDLFGFEVRKIPGGWEVWALDPFAHLVEWGSVKNPAYAPMRRAILALGLRFSRGKGGRGL